MGGWVGKNEWMGEVEVQMDKGGGGAEVGGWKDK